MSSRLSPGLACLLFLVCGAGHGGDTATAAEPTLALETGPGAAAVPAPSAKPDGRSRTPRRVARKAVPEPVEEPAPEEPAPEEFSEEIHLFAGETRVLSEANVGRLAVGNGKALSAAVLDRDEILLIANEVGISSLHIWTGKGKGRRIKVNVLPAETARVSREVAAFLAAIPEARVSTIGDKVVVEGDNLSDADLAKVEAIAKLYPQVISFANRAGWEKTIVMEVKVVEFPSNELREIGLKWNATGGVAIGAVWQPIRKGNDGPFQINLATGTDNAPPIAVSPDSGLSGLPLPSNLNILSHLNMGLNAQLNLMARNGTATILAEPMLSALSGSKATFLAGGEFPYEVSTVNGPSVFFREYGVKLDITPRVDRNGFIRARIASEVSNIDTSVTSRAGPALSTRKTETEFNVNSGDTIVLSGLLSRETSTEVDKVPLLGDLPVLGVLFRSKRFQNKETELVVFVTPHVADGRNSDVMGLMARTGEKLRAPEPAEPAKPAQEQPPAPGGAVAGTAAPDGSGGDAWMWMQ